MHTKRITLRVATLCMLLLLAGALVQAAGAPHLWAGVTASGGGQAASAGYRLRATAGQGSATGISQGATYRVVGGYVPRAPLVVRVRLPLVSAP